ncbi:hypothetical protein ACHWQZ_G016364 [Mnemiopsis leidyi]
MLERRREDNKSLEVLVEENVGDDVVDKDVRIVDEDDVVIPSDRPIEGSEEETNEVLSPDEGLTLSVKEEDNLVEEEVDKSVIPIDGSVEELKDFELPVTGSTMPELAVEDLVEDNLSLSLLLLADDSCNRDDEIGSADVSVKSVFLVKLVDGESVTYDVEKELLKLLVTVVGITVGMDDRTDVGEVPVVLSLSCPLPPSPPGSTFLVAKVDADDDSKEAEEDLLSSADLKDEDVYLGLVVKAENLLSVTAMEVPVDFPDVNNDDELTVTGVVEGIEGINDKLDITTDELVVVSFEDDTQLLSLSDDVPSSVQVNVDDLPVENVEEEPTVSVDSATDDKLLIDVLAVKLNEGDTDDIFSETDETIDDDENVIGVVVGIDGSSLVEEEEDKSVIPIDGSVDELKDFELLVKGSTIPELAVEDIVEDDLSLSLVLLADDCCDLDDKVGSADVSVKSVFLDKLADGESVTYDVEKELLKVLVTVVGVTVGMDDRTDVEEVPVVLSLSCPLPPSPPGSTFFVAEVDADDDS